MIRQLLVVILAAGLSLPAHAEQEPLPVITGNQLVSRCTSRGELLGWCLGYIVGITDMIEGMTAAQWHDFGTCIPDRITVEQLRDVVVLYIRKKPAMRDWAAAPLIYAALRDAFPCRRQ